MDELSASASEKFWPALCRIGAVQTIIGRRTFGKGLVQQQYPLSDGAALRLTIARYYTPLGRSIQRSYAKGKKVYMDELWDRYNSGEMFSEDSVLRHQNGKKFSSVCGKSLYEGDGITPDVFVPIDTSVTYNHLNIWLGSTKLNSYLYEYFMNNQAALNQYKSADAYTDGFPATALWDGLQKAAADSVKPTILKPVEKGKIALRMKALLARYKWKDECLFPGVEHLIR